MEWQQLEHFQVVAKLQHMTRAAELLSISQPALSRSVANLEAELGVPLFDRRGRQIELNEYGRRFVLRVDRAMREIRDGVEELRSGLDEDSGEISFSFLKSLGLSEVPAMLNAFLQQAPRIRFRLFQHATNVMLDQLEANEVDLALSSMTETRKHIEWNALWEEEIYACVPAGHRLSGREAVSIRELGEERWISVKRGYGLRTITDRLFEQARIAPDIVLEGEEVVTVAGFVSAGLGVSLLPALPSVQADNLVRLRVEESECRRVIGLAWKKDRTLSPAAERFRRFVFEAAEARRDRFVER